MPSAAMERDKGMQQYRKIGAYLALYLTSLVAGYLLFAPNPLPKPSISDSTERLSSVGTRSGEPQARQESQPVPLPADGKKGNVTVQAGEVDKEALRESFDAIRKEKAAWLRDKIRTGSLSALDIAYATDTLRIALSDPATRAAFEAHIFNTLSKSSSQVYLLEKTMRSLAQADAGVFDGVLQRAIKEGNWSVVGSALLASQSTLVLSPARVLDVAREVVHGDDYAKYHAIRALQKVTDRLPHKEVIQQMTDIYAGNSSDVGVPSQAFFLMNEGNLAPSDEVVAAMEQYALHGETVELRLLGTVHLLGAAGAEARTALQSSDMTARYRSGYEVAFHMGEIIQTELQDPDPLLRLHAARLYPEWARQLDEIAFMLQSRVNPKGP